MQTDIEVEGPEALKAYAAIPIAYEILETLDLDSPADQDSLLPFASKAFGPLIVKDYDALPGNNPLEWPARFDISDWGFLGAYNGGERIGGAIVVTKGSDVEMLEGRDDLAVLWDIRVTPAARERGVGSKLLCAAESWAKSHRAREMKIETQNTNVPACRFYARNGYVLRSAHRDAYPDLPGEIQLLWYKDLL